MTCWRSNEWEHGSDHSARPDVGGAWVGDPEPSIPGENDELHLPQGVEYDFGPDGIAPGADHSSFDE
jgi:hypothetical protein